MTVTIDNIPVYQAVIDDDNTGMMKISLVDSPAVRSDFLAFNKDYIQVTYRVADEEKRLVRGVVMRADFPIYRKSDKMGEFYIIYNADTIRTMAEKYLLESRQNNVNLMHADGSDVDGVQMVQYFIKDSEAGVSPAGFEDIAEGSLFAEFHVVNDEVWEQVKAGTYKGFSLEGVFNLVPETNVEMVKDIVKSLDGKFKNDKIMSKFNGIRQRIASILMEMGNVTTDKGILAWDGDDDLKAGIAVYVEDQDGNRTPAPDGDYKTSDGKVVKVSEGKVSEIVDPDAEVWAKFGRKTTDKGELIWDGEADLKAGDSVYVEKDGERVPAPDGDYRTEDKKIIKVADGKVTEIVDDEAEVAGVEQKNRKELMEKMKAAFSMSYNDRIKKVAESLSATLRDFYIEDAGDDFVIACVYDRDYSCKFFRYSVSWEGENPVIGDSREVRLAFIPVDQEVTFSAEMKSALEDEIKQLKLRISELEAAPIGKPAHEEFSGGGKPSGIKRFEKLERILKA